MKHIDLKREAIAGVTTFFTMAYIVVVNPAILASPGTGMPFTGVLTATVLVAFLMTMLMGVYAKLPFGVAPGMGLNAFFAYTLVLGRNVPWPEALGLVFWAGMLFLVLSLTNVRVGISRAIPVGLRAASAVGIGLFLTFIGLKNAGLVVASPATFVTMGAIDGKVLLSLAGLVITVVLMQRKSPLAFLAGIFAVTIGATVFGYIEPPKDLFSPPDFTSVLFKLDILGALKLSLLPAMIAVTFTDLFDSLSTFIGVSKGAGLVDEAGEPRNLKQALVVDALATAGAGLLGSSPGTAYIESVAGIEAGGRTGWTAVFTALCFLPCLFIAPLAGMVPGYATAPVLIIVGAMMFRTAKELDVARIEDMIPQFLVVVLIPLTFSITQGLLWGFIAHCVLYPLAGRGKELRPAMWGIGIVSVGLLVLEALT